MLYNLSWPGTLYVGWTSLELTASLLPLLLEALNTHVLRIGSSAAGEGSIHKLKCEHGFLYSVVSMTAGDN